MTRASRAALNDDSPTDQSNLLPQEAPITDLQRAFNILKPHVTHPKRTILTISGCSAMLGVTGLLMYLSIKGMQHRDMNLQDYANTEMSTLNASCHSNILSAGSHLTQPTSTDLMLNFMNERCPDVNAHLRRGLPIPANWDLTTMCYNLLIGSTLCQQWDDLVHPFPPEIGVWCLPIVALILLIYIGMTYTRSPARSPFSSVEKDATKVARVTTVCEEYLIDGIDSKPAAVLYRELKQLTPKTVNQSNVGCADRLFARLKEWGLPAPVHQPNEFGIGDSRKDYYQI